MCVATSNLRYFSFLSSPIVYRWEQFVVPGPIHSFSYDAVGGWKLMQLVIVHEFHLARNELHSHQMVLGLSWHLRTPAYSFVSALQILNSHRLIV